MKVRSTIERTVRPMGLAIAFLLALAPCMLAPASASADSVYLPDSSGTGVGILLSAPAAVGADAWSIPPLIAQPVPLGPGVVYYRFGAGPGEWKPWLGPIIVPSGKQQLSAILVAPGGTPGAIGTLITRSDSRAVTASTGFEPDDERTYSTEPTATGTVVVTAVVRPQVGVVMRRLGGATRYGTGAVIAGSGTKRSNTVIIATGENFPDALTASGLAGCLGAPVLLVRRTSLPVETRNQIKSLKAKHAIICGGPPAVDRKVERSLRSIGLSVERLAGKSRYETAIAVAQRIQKLNGGRTGGRAFIARGAVFHDALIVAPLAYKTRAPVLLSSARTLTPSTAKRLSAARYTKATLIGNGLSAAVENGVRSRVATVTRWAGTDQYSTSVQVAANSVLEGSLSWSYVGIARGDIFPDALCGAALCGKKGGVILLTQPKSLDPRVSGALQAHVGDVTRCEIYGSSKAVTTAVYNQIWAIFH
jgi:putative cell wall-binding protein